MIDNYIIKLKNSDTYGSIGSYGDLKKMKRLKHLCVLKTDEINAQKVKSLPEVLSVKKEPPMILD